MVLLALVVLAAVGKFLLISNTNRVPPAPTFELVYWVCLALEKQYQNNMIRMHAGC